MLANRGGPNLRSLFMTYKRLYAYIGFVKWVMNYTEYSKRLHGDGIFHFLTLKQIINV